MNGGLFTPLLWRLPVGHRMRMIGPKGKFMLEPDDERTHLFISTGTGQRALHLDDEALSSSGRAAQDGLPQRRVLRATWAIATWSREQYVI